MILTIQHTLLNASSTRSSHRRFLNEKRPRQVWVSGSVCLVHKPEVGGRTQGVQSMPEGSPGRTAVGGETASRNWAFLKTKDKINTPDHNLPHALVKGAQTRPGRWESYKGCTERNSGELENSPDSCTSPTKTQSPELTDTGVRGELAASLGPGFAKPPIRHVMLLPCICLAFSVCGWLLNSTLLDLSNVCIS